MIVPHARSPRHSRRPISTSISRARCGPTTLRELAAEAGIEVPPIRGFGNFSAFSGMYVAACAGPDLPRRPRAPHPRGRRGRRARRRGLGRARGLRPAPQRSASAPPSEILEIILECRRRRGARESTSASASSSPPIAPSTRPTRSTRRTSPSKYADRGVVGFGLANDETGHPPEPFAEAFAIAREAGLLSVPHAGELDGPASVRGALDALGRRPPAARRAGDRGPGAGAPPRRLARVPRRVPHVERAAVGRSRHRLAPAPGAPRGRACGAASTPTTRCSSARTCSRSTSWSATEHRPRRRDARARRHLLDRRVGGTGRGQAAHARRHRGLARQPPDRVRQSTRSRRPRRWCRRSGRRR